MTNKFTKFASIILEIAIDKTLDYGLNAEQAGILKKGMAVEVPVRGTLRRGYVFAIKDQAEVEKVAPLARIISEQELITEDLFELALWIAKYYHTPLSSVIKTILPGSVRKTIAPKMQLFVSRAKSREDLKNICIELRSTNPSQANVLDVMLNVTKGIFLSELLELTGGSRSPVDTLHKKGFLHIEEILFGAAILQNEEYFQTKPKKLGDEQKLALDKICKSLEEERFETHLLFGVTGSGKTEVYLQAIQKALDLGKSTIMLIPEIALTAQTVERFRSRFHGKIAILHHRLSDGERTMEWQKIRSGEAKIVIGARSAIFSPVENLGLIIVDEEHEHTYKQSDDAPRYHARDVAIVRASFKKASVILGSATPSLESFYNVERKKYTLSTLSLRADNATMPTVSIIDMKKEFDRAGGFTLFSEPLISGIKKRYENGEQSILFLNRRGYYTTQLCKECSHVMQCPHCDLNLTFHLGDNALSCHLCGYVLAPPPKSCPACKGSAIQFRGAGTEHIERALHAILPDVRTLRIDADTTKHKGSHEKLLREFRTGKADVLIGTQMITKGLHFPLVTMVGVLNCDTSLNIPDFRASENVFQLITQVSGRSGRGFVPGEVIIQTLLADHSVIKLAAMQDYEAFYKEEIEIRKLFGYPPFTHMIKVTFTGPSMAKTFECAKALYLLLEQRLKTPFFLNAVIPAGYAKVKDKFRYQFIARGPSVYHMNEQLSALLQTFKLPHDIHLAIDIDPNTTFF